MDPSIRRCRPRSDGNTLKRELKSLVVYTGYGSYGLGRYQIVHFWDPGVLLKYLDLSQPTSDNEQMH